MQRRTFLVKTLNRITAGITASVVFNPFEVIRSIGSVYSSNTTETSGSITNNSSIIISRRTVDDQYVLTYNWDGRMSQRWKLRFPVEQSAYQVATQQPLGYLGAFHAAHRNQTARRLADQLEYAERAGRSETDLPPEIERLDRAVEFVRSLTYMIDPDSRNIPEYHRAVEETLVDGCGDCKDLTYLLAGILSHPPFEYQTAMVILPEHMLLGVRKSDLPSAYANTPALPDSEYIAIESIYSKPIGEFGDDPVLAIYDGEFTYFDQSAVM